ncbi:MAG: hypothetical protein H6585_04520 [Flavobacteriales bacterium]|nr:hypothetical protein [Flavobacteriales bacterium]MCB9447591.1 hypothetical protein [Flavobacteriales bacterium]
MEKTALQACKSLADSSFTINKFIHWGFLNIFAAGMEIAHVRTPVEYESRKVCQRNP